MRVYSGDGLGDIYYDLIRDITEHGRKITTRGLDCLELPGLVVLEYHVPGACWMRIPGRKFNPFFALAEIPWILSGNGNVEWISYFNSNMRSFQDGNNPDFHGAYGLRIRRWESGRGFNSCVDQIVEMVKKLQADPFSRQAIISIWDPARDNDEYKDIPCNNHICYTLRDGKLHQTVTIRSNDVVWGTPHNAVQFTHLHAYVAGLLGVKMGLFTYVIHNLHYYLDQYKPTLSNLIDRAYLFSGQSPHLCSEILEGFTTFGDLELHRMVQTVDGARAFHEHGQGGLAVSHNTYTNKIADIIQLFIMAKTGRLPGLAYEIMADLPVLMRDLIIDFWDGSTNPAMQKVADHLRRNNDVCV